MTSDNLAYVDQLIIKNNRVHRPVGFWTEQVHRFLDTLQNQSSFLVPRFLGFDEQGREMLNYIEGEVIDYPQPITTSILKSAANLLRKYHDISQNFLINHGSSEKCWQLPCRCPKEVICHGDFAPHNVVCLKDQAIGIIDFDTCHPAPRSWDIAYALYRWVPLTSSNNEGKLDNIGDQIKRAYLFCESYGLSSVDRVLMPDLIVERLEALIDFMLTQASKGSDRFKANIENGHHILYSKDIEYIKLIA